MSRGKIATVNISDYMANRILGFGEDNLDRIVSSFSSIDRHVQAFLKGSAKDFARQHMSVTHLVFSNDMAELLGYFTLAIKSITVRAELMSKTVERIFKKMGKFDKEQNTYTVAAYLIAQLGRNFSPSLKNNITGNELLEVALHLLKGVQYDIGGTIVFLEAQDNGKLLSFYASNGFREFDRRMSSNKDGTPCELVQLFKIL